MHTDQKATTNSRTLAHLTTLGLGGPAGKLVEVTDAAETVAAVRSAGSSGEAVLVLAGGSNVVVPDAGFDGTVVLLRSSGVTKTFTDPPGRVDLHIAAGHNLEELVAECVAEGLGGLECLSGIPGSVGATPIQNVGAYGREISEVLQSVTAYDRAHDQVVTLRPADCGFSYRNSVFKRSDRYVVLEVALRLRRDRMAAPVRYGELSRRLAVEGEQRVPLVDVRAAVLELRRGKGMVIDPADPDTRSVGSFFTNPVLSADEWAAFRADSTAEPPHWELSDGSVKVAAAWLIEHAGFAKGFRRGGVGISSKHTLALVNYGGTTTELLALAREITDGVRDRYDISLTPEPVLVGGL